MSFPRARPRAARMRHALSREACDHDTLRALFCRQVRRHRWRGVGTPPPDEVVVKYARAPARSDPCCEEVRDYDHGASLVRRAISIVPPSRRCCGGEPGLCEASTTAGGAVYSGQDVRGLSDCAADHQLVAALQLCGSEETIQLGPANHRFLAQSCFKPLTFAMALESGLGDAITASVASVGDQPFGTFALTPDGRALNPLINSGALVVLELLSRTPSEEEVGVWPHTRRRCGDGACFDDKAVDATFWTRCAIGLSTSSQRRRAAGPRTLRVLSRVAALDCLQTDAVELARRGGVCGRRPHPRIADSTRTAMLSAMLHAACTR